MIDNEVNDLRGFLVTIFGVKYIGISDRMKVIVIKSNNKFILRIDLMVKNASFPVFQLLNITRDIINNQ